MFFYRYHDDMLFYAMSHLGHNKHNLLHSELTYFFTDSVLLTNLATVANTHPHSPQMAKEQEFAGTIYVKFKVGFTIKIYKIRYDWSYNLPYSSAEKTLSLALYTSYILNVYSIHQESEFAAGSSDI
jgi:hypothetical protein